MADGVLLVVESGHTRRDPAKRAVETLQQSGARLLGIVLNRMRSRDTYYSYSNRYYSTGPEKSQSRSSAATSSTT
jgi:Mrp family chromosome partitioning ATPase